MSRNNYTPETPVKPIDFRPFIGVITRFRFFSVEVTPSPLIRFFSLQKCNPQRYGGGSDIFSWKDGHEGEELEIVSGKRQDLSMIVPSPKVVSLHWPFL